MWAYEDGRGRRTSDLPRSSATSSRPVYYYDDDGGYGRPAYTSGRYAQQDPIPQTSSRRKSIPVNSADTRPSRRANVVASDDGSDYGYGRNSRTVYGSSLYPERLSRHDVERKTSTRDKNFRDKRSTWAEDEARNMKRAKSYSPQRATRDMEAQLPRKQSPPAKSSIWPEDDYTRKSGKKGTAQQYYEEHPLADYGKTRDRGAAYDYPSAGVSRQPMTDRSPYKISAPSVDETPSRHSRGREKVYHDSGYDDYPKTTKGYDRGFAAEKSSSRSHRHSKAREDQGAWESDPYSDQPQAPHRGRYRPDATATAATTPGGIGDYSDPYDRATPTARQRQSLPPRARSRYAEDDTAAYEDPYGPPRRRANSVSQGARGRDRYGDPDVATGTRNRKDPYYYDDQYARGSPGGSPGPDPGVASGSSSKKKGKKWPQQAGKLFMTHAVPVIRKEAVPFLTKAAQAYFEQRR